MQNALKIYICLRVSGHIQYFGSRYVRLLRRELTTVCVLHNFRVCFACRDAFSNMAPPSQEVSL